MSRRALFLCLLTAVLLKPLIGHSQAARRGAGPPAQAAAARVTFAETIAPIVYANCVTCHRPGEAAPFPLISYEDVAKRGALIVKVTESRYMPPWHAEPGYGEFVGERRLTDAQIAAIGAWVKEGMPRGDDARMPRLPEFPPDGWRLGQPDLILEMPVAFEVPAGGPDVFRNFVIPTKLTEDKWVRGVEFRPSARKVVHHALFAQVPGGSRANLDGADGRPGFGGLSAVGFADRNDPGLGGWVPGSQPAMFSEGLVSRLPKGSDFLLQVHFHPSGKVESEKSLIGIYFAEKGNQKDLAAMMLPAAFGFGAGIDIPPGEKQFIIKDSFTLPGDAKVYGAFAHAHYLGKEMKADATLPDGSTRPLLWIRDWDFNWQDSYTYKKPFILPKGTRIDVTLTYDNSADNPRNPINPPRRAIFGEQSFDEMGTVGFEVEIVNKPEVDAFHAALASRNKSATEAASKNGTLGRLLARGARRAMQQLTVFDRQGNVVTRIGEVGSYSQAAFSPDGSRIAVVKNDPDTDGRDIWAFDVATGKGTAITADAPPDSAPIWSTDGTEIAYVSDREKTHSIFKRAANGSGTEELVYTHPPGPAIILTDWSADGRYLCFWAGETMFVLPLTGERKAIEVGRVRGGRFSPDSRLVAFSSNQSGRFLVYVKDLASATSQTSAADALTQASQVSPEAAVGGIFWRRDGKELFYLSQQGGQGVMSVDVEETAPFRVGAPKLLFKLPTGVLAPAQLSNLGTPDGQRFVFAVVVSPRRAAQ
jgi:mono/diheme cytochrome c family protein/WD40 repeat protein